MGQSATQFYGAATRLHTSFTQSASFMAHDSALFAGAPLLRTEGCNYASCHFDQPSQSFRALPQRSQSLALVTRELTCHRGKVGTLGLYHPFG